MDDKDVTTLLGPPPDENAASSLSPVVPRVPFPDQSRSEDFSAAASLLSNPDYKGPPGSIPDQAAHVQKLREAFKKVNEVQGVPLDVDTGADAATRLALGFYRRPEDKERFLKSQFGNVRFASDGTPIVRVTDPQTGKFKDLLVNEMGMHAKDVMDLGGSLPEIAGGLVAMRKGDVRGVWPALVNIGRVALGSEAAGALKDASVRAVSGQPVEPGEILGTRARMAAFDVGTGALLGVAGKALPKVVSPFANPQKATFDMRQARKYFEAKGYNLPMTVGEATGNPFFLRSETYIRAQPGSGWLHDVIKNQNAELQKIQNIALGLPAEATASDVARLPTSEKVGEKSMAAIGEKVEPAKQAAKAAQEGLADTGTRAATRELQTAAGGGPIDPVALGKSIRDSAMAKRDAFFAQSAEDYAKVYGHPLANQYVLETDELAARAKKFMKDELPSPEKIVKTASPLVDLFGGEILRDETGQAISRPFVSANVLTKLNELASLEKGKVRLGDLLRMRTDVANDIAQGEAIPGMDTHYLKEIRGMLTDTINSELDKLPDKSLKALWEKANANYAAGVKPFQQAGIAELFREPSQSNFLGNSQVVQRSLGGERGTDIWNAYKEFFGANSQQFNGMKRAVADNLLNQSMDIRNEFIDADSFVRKLVALQRDHPVIANDVMGGKGKQLVNIGLLMAAGEGNIGKIASQFEGKVQAKALEDLIQSGDVTATKLRELLDKEEQLNKIYQNKIVHQIATGKFNGDKIDPSEFVARFSTQAEPKDIHQVMAMLSDRPDILQDIKAKTVQAILDKATISHSQTAGEILSGLPGELSSSGIIKALGDPTQMERYRAILGADTYRDLEEMAKFLGPREAAQRSYAAAGGIAAGTKIAALEQGKVMKFADAFARGLFYSFLLSSTTLRKWFSKTTVTPETSSKIANYAIASTPFIESLYRTYGAQRSKRIMAELKAAIDQRAKETGEDINAPDAADAGVEQLLGPRPQ